MVLIFCESLCFVFYLRKMDLMVPGSRCLGCNIPIIPPIQLLTILYLDLHVVSYARCMSHKHV